MFLTSSEISELTGLVYPKKQIEWLRKNGYLFTVNNLGIPKVLYSHIESKLGGVQNITEQKSTKHLLNLSNSKYFG